MLKQPPALARFINLNDYPYPIHDLQCPESQQLFKTSQTALQQQALCVLPGFLRPAAVTDQPDMVFPKDTVQSVLNPSPEPHLGTATV